MFRHIFYTLPFSSQDSSSCDMSEGTESSHPDAQGASSGDDYQGGNGDEAGALAAELETAKAELNAALTKQQETHNQMLRIAADFDNARKRFEKEKHDVRLYAMQDFARDLLPVIDSFEKAMTTLDGSGLNFETEEGKKISAVLEGVQMVSNMFHDSFKKYGIERLPGKGSVFNPMYHNAIDKFVDASVTQDTVSDEFVAGYKIGERVLRTALVRVAIPE